MHRRRVVTAILTVAVLLLGPGVSESSGAKRQTVAVRQSVLASYSVRDPSGCVTTSVFVSADTSAGMLTTEPTPSRPGAQIALTRTDACAKRTLLTASGSVVFEGDELESEGNPRNARLDTVIPATDVATGSAVELRVDLAWTGVGDVERSAGSPAPPEANAPRVRTRYRRATLSGTVSDGTTDFAPGPDATASLTTAVARASGSGDGTGRSRTGLGGAVAWSRRSTAGPAGSAPARWSGVVPPRRPSPACGRRAAALAVGSVDV